MSDVLDKYMVELTPPNLPLMPGMRSQDVRRLQEWLTLAGYVVSCDGDFGPATAAAVQKFKEFTPGNPERSKDPTPEVGPEEWNTLSLPLVRATKLPTVDRDTLGEAVCRMARQYLGERAREVGGDNRGVWQRHFSRGREGQPWCQDFATTCVFDAARALRRTKLPFPLVVNGVASSYVPWVVDSARRNGMLMASADPRPIPVGSMFFLKSANPQVPYSHVGIVTKDLGNAVETIEGNTNADGSANGFEVASRHRARGSCDYGLISPLN